MTLDLDDFAAEYFRLYRALSADAPREERLRAARFPIGSPSDRVDELIRRNAEEGWVLVLALVERAPTDEALAFVAAGPIEDLLRRRGADWAHQIATDARGNDRLRLALNWVWGWDVFADEVTAEVFPLLDPEVRSHWNGVKAAARDGTGSRSDAGNQRGKARWRPPPMRPREDRIK